MIPYIRAPLLKSAMFIFCLLSTVLAETALEFNYDASTKGKYSFNEAWKLTSDGGVFILNVDGSQVQIALSPAQSATDSNAYLITVAGGDDENENFIKKGDKKLDSNPIKDVLDVPSVIWIAYDSGKIAIGKGEVLGKNTFLEYKDDKGFKGAAYLGLGGGKSNISYSQIVTISMKDVKSGSSTPAEREKLEKDNKELQKKLEELRQAVNTQQLPVDPADASLNISDVEKKAQTFVTAAATKGVSVEIIEKVKLYLNLLQDSKKRSGEKSSETIQSAKTLSLVVDTYAGIYNVSLAAPTTGNSSSPSTPLTLLDGPPQDPKLFYDYIVQVMAEADAKGVINPSKSQMQADLNVIKTYIDLNQLDKLSTPEQLDRIGKLQIAAKALVAAIADKQKAAAAVPVPAPAPAPAPAPVVRRVVSSRGKAKGRSSRGRSTSRTSRARR